MLIQTAPAAAATAPTDCFPSRPRFITSGLKTLAPRARLSVSEAQEIFKRLHRIYSQDVAQAGGRLAVIELPSMEFGAWALRNESTFILQLTQGVRYHPRMNADTYAQILCHELGHHLGGFPHVTDSWASAEGQADYFATAKCMRRYYESLTGEQLFSEKQSLAIVDLCQKQFERGGEVQICARTLAASLNLSGISVELSEVPQPEPALESTDPRTVERTQEGHPLAQCRLDTYRAGALCPVPWTEPFSAQDEYGGACSTERWNERARPLCWFSPARPLTVARQLF